MFKFLLIVQTLVAASLVSVILMLARGAADFLTRSTAVLGGLFVILSITLAAIAGTARQPMQVDTSLANRVGTAPATAPANEQQQPAAPAQNETAPAVPLAQ
jgi:preprotein translocase subunit SecG